MVEKAYRSTPGLREHSCSHSMCGNMGTANCCMYLKYKSFGVIKSPRCTEQGRVHCVGSYLGFSIKRGAWSDEKAHVCNVNTNLDAAVVKHLPSTSCE